MINEITVDQWEWNKLSVQRYRGFGTVKDCGVRGDDWSDLICAYGLICDLSPHPAGAKPAAWPCWSPRCKRMPTRWRKTSSALRSCWLWWELEAQTNTLMIHHFYWLLLWNHPNCCLLPPGFWKWQERAALWASDWDISQAGRGWGPAEGPFPGRRQSQEAQTPPGQRDRERVSCWSFNSFWIVSQLPGCII